MPNTNTDLQRKAGFFHSLGKVLTEQNNLAGNEPYKSAHNVLSEEVWLDSINYSPSFASASQYSDNVVVTQVGTVSNPAYLYPLTQTNYQTWFLDTGTPSATADGFSPSENWIKPFINPSDVTNDAGYPSFGFQLLMYRPNGTTQIAYNTAFYEVDYFAGLIRFQENATPKDSALSNGLGFQFNQSVFESTPNVNKKAYINNTSTGGPRVIVWQYVGQVLSDFSMSGGTITQIVAGSGLTGGGQTGSITLDVNVNPDSLEIINDVIRVKDTITGDKTFTGSLVIDGNLTVQGTQSVIYTENIYIEDTIITLNATYSGPYNAVDTGIEANLGGGTYATLIWDSSTSLWSAGYSGSVSSIITESGTGLTKSGNELSLDFQSVVGTGLTQNGSQISIDTTGFASSIAGDGLSANGGTLSVNVDNGLSISLDTVVLGGTLSQDTTIFGDNYNYQIEFKELKNNISGVTRSGFHELYIGDIGQPDSSLIVGPNLASLTAWIENGASYSYVGAESSEVHLEIFGPAGQSNIRIVTDKESVLDGSIDNTFIVNDGISSKGLVYNDDYSPNFTTYSLVTKGFVESIIGIVNADNGLQIVSPGVVSLGGTLSTNTTIDGNTVDFTVGNASRIFMTASIILQNLVSDTSGYSENTLNSTTFDTKSVSGITTSQVTGNTTTGLNVNITNGNSDVAGLNMFYLGQTINDGSSDNKMVIVDDEFQKGLVYFDDYASNFTTYSLITKGYVDSAISGFGAGTIAGVTAGSGLSGGGTANYITIEIADTLAGTGLTYSAGVIDMIWSGTSSGLTFSNDSVNISVDNSTIVINNQGQLSVVSGASTPVTDRINPSLTSGNDSASGLLITSTPNDYSRIQVFVNGQLQRLGSGVTTLDCYISSTASVAENLNNLVSGQQLFWNGLIAGFELDGNDILEIVYES